VFIAGTTDGQLGARSFGGTDIFVAKYTLSGKRLWLRTLGGEGQDVATSVSASADGGVVVSGFTRSARIRGERSHGDYDVLAVRLAPNGDVTWIRLFGSARAEQAFDAVGLPGGGTLLVGERIEVVTPGPVPCFRTRLLLTHVSASGAQVWSRTLGGAQTDWYGRAAGVSDGRITVGGGTRPQCHAGTASAGARGLVLSITPGGAVTGRRFLSFAESVNAVVPAGDASLLGGGSTGTDGRPRAFAARMLRDGSVSWSRRWPVEAGHFAGLAALPDGIAVATSAPSSRQGDSWDLTVSEYCPLSDSIRVRRAPARRSALA
jgi:hypothetical protein